jgi:5-methyltetrahydrofolate--homocysteine methyltransferase
MVKNSLNLRLALESGRPLLIDTAMGTSLLQHGMSSGSIAEEYNLEFPHIIEEIHRLNVEAGADIICTNTFGANKYKLAEKNLQVARVIDEAIKIARQASGGRVWVALDIGPIGTMLKPYGDLEIEEARDVFAEQVQIGCHSDVDLIIIETMFDLEELSIAAEQAKLHGHGRPVFCSVTIQNKDRTLMGNSINEIATRLIDLEVDAFGINCGFGPAQMKDLVSTLLAANQGRIRSLMQPNAGLPKINADQQIIYDMPPSEYCKIMQEIFTNGVTILGGCCGTTPEYLKQLRQMVPRES